MLPALLLAAAAATAAAGHVRELIVRDRWKDALAEAKELVAQPHDADADAALGEALYRAGRIDEADEVLSPLAERDDAPARALAQLGLVRAAQGKGVAAAGLMERAIAQAPRDPWVAYRAAGAARTRARANELLSVFIDAAGAEDADRVEGARGTIRLNQALGERKVWISVASPDHAELPLKPMVGTGGGYFVEVTLANRKKIRLLLDTGSTGLFVVERAVKKGGLTPLSEETVFAGGGAGRTASARGLLEKLTIGGVEFADALVTTTKEEFDPQGRIHGVLGLDVFSGYRVTMDLAHGRLALDRCGSETGGTPFWDVSGQMLVRASAAGVEGLFLFDTGATRSMFARAYSDAVPGAQVASAAAVRTYGGNVAGAASVRGVKLRFLDLEGEGGPAYTADLTQRSRLGGVEISGFLGMDLIDGSKVVIDTCAQRVAIPVVPSKRP